MIYEYYSNLPTEVVVGKKVLKIRNQCDYRIALECFEILNDENLSYSNRLKCCLVVFYENYNEIERKEIEEALRGMFKVLAYGEEEKSSANQSERLMDWQHDFKYIAPPISRILGYDVRTPDRYCHFWTFLGAYMEIGECAFSTIVSIRKKRSKGKKLEKWELEFWREHAKMIDLPQKLTTEEQEFLNSDW